MRVAPGFVRAGLPGCRCPAAAGYKRPRFGAADADDRSDRPPSSGRLSQRSAPRSDRGIRLDRLVADAPLRPGSRSLRGLVSSCPLQPCTRRLAQGEPRPGAAGRGRGRVECRDGVGRDGRCPGYKRGSHGPMPRTTNRAGPDRLAAVPRRALLRRAALATAVGGGSPHDR
jgi:hypothetical protein